MQKIHEIRLEDGGFIKVEQERVYTLQDMEKCFYDSRYENIGTLKKKWDSFHFYKTDILDKLK